MKDFFNTCLEMVPKLKVLDPREDVPVELKSNPNLIAHVKRNGHMLAVHFSPRYAEGYVAFSRRPTDLTKQLSYLITPFVRTVPEDTIIFGELWREGGDESQIKTAIKAKDLRLRFDAFAAVAPSVRIMRQERSLLPTSPLRLVEAAVTSWGIPFIDHIGIGGIDKHAIKFMREAEHDSFDVEGFVLKSANLQGWWKWKPCLTFDLIIDGFTEGKGANLGLVGSIEAKTFEGYRIADVGGMTQEQRVDFSFEPEKFIGKVIEVEYTSVTRYGRLRHPRFIRLRDDKVAKHCPATQDDRIYAYWSGAK